MICPYIVTRKVRLKVNHILDDDGNCVADEQVEINEAAPIKCHEANCGAWKAGICRYGYHE